jgi:hypothetical protein
MAEYNLEIQPEGSFDYRIREEDLAELVAERFFDFPLVPGPFAVGVKASRLDFSLQMC